MLKENGFRLACIVPGFLKESNKGPKKKSWEVVIGFSWPSGWRSYKKTKVDDTQWSLITYL